MTSKTDRGWLCPHPGHSTGDCGSQCECAERIRNHTYGVHGHVEEEAEKTVWDLLREYIQGANFPATGSDQRISLAFQAGYRHRSEELWHARDTIADLNGQIHRLEKEVDLAIGAITELHAENAQLKTSAHELASEIERTRRDP